jgi:predicted exporter
MGQSCGGLQAIDAARDPRVSVPGVWNSGLFPDAQKVRIVAAAEAPKSLLPTLQVSAIYVTGAPGDQAFSNSEDDFARLGAIPALRLWREVAPQGRCQGGAHVRRRALRFVYAVKLAHPQKERRLRALPPSSK